MHVPDGFLDAPTSIATGAIGVAAVAAALAGSRRELTDRTAPMAGLVATFVFATQMLNFPVGAGTSGHLLGGALATVLVGPWTGLLCMSVVLIVQSLLFADGGITALGTNITLMGVLSVGIAWVVVRVLLWVLPSRLSSVGIAAACAALISVPASALGFVGLYAIGGQAPIPLDTLTMAMVGWHVVIGVGEAVITLMLVGSVLGVRPDLAWAARKISVASTLEVRPARTKMPA